MATEKHTTKGPQKIKKGKKTAVDASRGLGTSAFRIPPEAFHLVGRDIAPGRERPYQEDEHPLWEDRALNAPHLPTVETMVHEGYSPNSVIKVRKNGPLLEIVEGRQRVINAREANLRRKALGLPLIEVPFMIVKGTDTDMFGAMLSENANRIDLKPLQLAKKALKFMAMCQDEERVARASGKSVQDLRRLLSVFDLDPTILTAIEAGETSVSAVLDSNLPSLVREQQVTAFQELIASGAKPTAKEVKSRVKAIQDGNGEEAFTAPGKRLLAKILGDEGIEEVFDTKAIQAIRWVLGDLNPRQIKGLTALIAKHTKK